MRMVLVTDPNDGLCSSQSQIKWPCVTYISRGGASGSGIFVTGSHQRRQRLLRGGHGGLGEEEELAAIVGLDEEETAMVGLGEGKKKE